MSTVKISQLPIIGGIDANTANTLFAGVDVPSGSTGKITAQTLARGLYSNEVLNVGGNPIVYPNVAAQFASTSNTYLQINLQNFNSNGSSDVVASTSDSDNANNYVDMGINGKTFNDPIYTSMRPYDSYLYSHGPDHTSYQGNLVIGTASSDANIVFIAGGTLTQNIVGRISKNTFDFLKDTRVTGNVTATGTVTGTNITILQDVNLTQNASISAAFGLANTLQGGLNTANTNIAVMQGVNLTQNTYTQAAFDKANNALANSSGTFAGNLTISGNANVTGMLNVTGEVNMNATLVLANSTFSATEAAFTITAAGSSQTPTQAGTLMQLTSKANTPARVLIDSFGTSNTAYPVIAGRNARGTVTSPTATQNNDILLRIAGNSYGTTGYAPFGDARIDFVATENHSDTNRGSRIRFWNTPTGSNVVNEIASFNADSVYFTGTVSPEKGFIYTPTILPGAQTAFTIDFSTTPVIKATLTADLTITLSNYVYGKVVEVWLTNTGGTTRTITHGCTATNSSENSATFTMPGTSSAYLRYFSIGGDNANTFVAIQHA